MSRPRIRGIFFDLGNVLVRLEAGRFAQKMKSLTGLGIDQLPAGFADGLVLSYECGRLNDDEFLARLCSRLGLAITKSDFLTAWTCIFDADPLIPEELLRELSGRYPLWAVSNTNRLHFEFIRTRYRFLEHFRGWILSYEVGAAKPDPAIFVHALNKARMHASEALFIDDQEANVESARDLGMDAIRFENHDRLIEEFRIRNIITNYQ